METDITYSEWKSVKYVNIIVDIGAYYIRVGKKPEVGEADR